jgi:hypothetical protein
MPSSPTLPVLTPTITPRITRAPIITTTGGITSRGTVAMLGVRAPPTTSAILAITAIVAAVRVRRAAVAGDVFSTHHPYRNKVPKHLLLEGDERVAGKNKPSSSSKRSSGSLMRRALALGRSSTRSVQA